MAKLTSPHSLQSVPCDSLGQRGRTPPVGSPPSVSRAACGGLCGGWGAEPDRVGQGPPGPAQWGTSNDAGTARRGWGDRQGPAQVSIPVEPSRPRGYHHTRRDPCRQDDASGRLQSDTQAGNSEAAQLIAPYKQADPRPRPCCPPRRRPETPRGDDSRDPRPRSNSPT